MDARVNAGLAGDEDKVLLKDLPSLYGIADTQELNRFFNVLAFNTGDEVGLEALSKHANIGKQRLAEYLEYLEAAFLIRRVHRIDQNALRLKRARTFKVYLTNPAVRAALFGFVRAEDQALGNLAETAVWSQWLHDTAVSKSLHYARWKSGRQDLEVDIVSVDLRTQEPRFAVEIKWSDRVPEDLREVRGLKELVGRHTLVRRPLVTTRTYTGRATLDGIEIEFAPVAVHCYTIARNLLRPKNQDDRICDGETSDPRARLYCPAHRGQPASAGFPRQDRAPRRDRVVRGRLRRPARPQAA